MPPLLNAGRDFCAPRPPHYHHRQSDKPNTSNYEGSQFNHIHLGCSFRRFQQPCKTARFLCAHSSVIVAVSGSSAPGSAKPPSAVRRAARGGKRRGGWPVATLPGRNTFGWGPASCLVSPLSCDTVASLPRPALLGPRHRGFSGPQGHVDRLAIPYKRLLDAE